MQVINLSPKDIYQGSLILVNKDYPYAHKNDHLVSYQQQLIDEKALFALQKIFQKIKAENQIKIVSCYRSAKEQEQIYQQSIIDHGQDYTQKFVALPHCSEHETGLAIDLGYNQEPIDFICPSFPYSGICQKWRDLSYDYGFIERYENDKKDKTHIDCEPWHFRYVGFPHSVIMKENNLCLEEYHQFLKQFSIYHPYQYVCHSSLIEIFFIQLDSQETLCLQDRVQYQISGNNIDGVIVTTRRSCL